MIDAERFPIAAKYLARLPDGIRSYPDCQAKGSVLRSVLDTAPFALPTAGLPSEAAELVAAPPLPSEWMSEVILNVLLMAYQQLMPREQYLRWCYDRNRALLNTSLYRVLFLVVSPERLYVGMPQRWAAFRRGTKLQLAEMRGQVATLEYTFPRLLQDADTCELMAEALSAAGDAATGGTGTRVSLVEVKADSALLRVDWSQSRRDARSK